MHADAVVEPSVELLRAVLTTQHGDPGLAKGPLESTLGLRITQYIRAHLADPDLSAARIAAAHDISVRHLYTVLSRLGISLGDWIRSHRLAECRRELSGPNNAAADHRSDRTKVGLRERDPLQQGVQTGVRALASGLARPEPLPPLRGKDTVTAVGRSPLVVLGASEEKSRTSSARSSGTSIAAKWPPRSNSDQRLCGLRGAGLQGLVGRAIRHQLPGLVQSGAVRFGQFDAGIRDWPGRQAGDVHPDDVLGCHRAERRGDARAEIAALRPGRSRRRQPGRARPPHRRLPQRHGRRPQ